ncbi:MAG TPA: hypothetical protein VFG62_04660 [Rhodopila sp.]|nr:hypothetical protein [Rhodopila sp.]
MNNVRRLTLAGVAAILLAACSVSPDDPQAASRPEVPPGTLTAHINGAVGASFGTSH